MNPNLQSKCKKNNVLLEKNFVAIFLVPNFDLIFKAVDTTLQMNFLKFFYKYA